MARERPHGVLGEHTTIERLAETVRHDGFVAVGAQEMRGALPTDNLMTLRRAWHDLPADDQMTTDVAYRYRRYGRLLVDLAGTEPMHEPLPPVGFQQEGIPMWRGRRRVFAPIEPAVLLDPVLLALVDFDVRLGQAVCDVRVWTVGLHLIRVVARDGPVGWPTPEGRHRDGHLFVGIHLLGRHDCTGGRSLVYPEVGEPVELTLVEPLDSMFVADQRVTHEVTPIETTGPHGHRDVLLVDLNPVGRDGPA